jgi:hypothetical protein
LLGQTYRDFDVFISDQTEAEDYTSEIEILTICRAFAVQERRVRVFKHLPRRGMAEQRNFLLSLSQAKYVQFLDDDLLLEPEVVERMLGVIEEEKCGFVGCCAIGLSHLDDYRPHQHNIELWDGPVKPEQFEWETIPWERHKVHNAANAYHLYQKLAPHGGTIKYKVAWVGANVMYDRAKLLHVGGFSWWNLLPTEHAGEEVLAQLLLLRKYGGCGVLPSGTYHLELPTLVEDRRVNATSLFQQLTRETHTRGEEEAVILEGTSNDESRGENSHSDWKR